MAGYYGNSTAIQFTFIDKGLEQVLTKEWTDIVGTCSTQLKHSVINTFLSVMKNLLGWCDFDTHYIYQFSHNNP